MRTLDPNSDDRPGPYPAESEPSQNQDASPPALSPPDPDHSDPAERHRINRRRLLASGAATGAAAVAAPLAFRAVDAQNGTPAATPGGTPAATPVGTPDAMAGMNMSPGASTNQGFTIFVPFQAAIIQAAAARLIPTDDTGPGATEAGVVYFIDRQIAKEGMGYRGNRYVMGPFLSGEPTQGDQSALPIRDQFRVGIFGLEAYAQQTFQQGFVACTPEQQDQLLTDLSQGKPEGFGGSSFQTNPLAQGSQLTPNLSLETTLGATSGATAFFTLLRNYTMAGFFADPVQGGNRDMVGWKMIGFPGAHLSYFDVIENYNQPFEGDYISLGQYQEQVGGGL